MAIEETERYILLVEPAPGADVVQFSGPKQISPEALGQRLQEFAGGLSEALEHLQTVAGSYSLTEITLEAELNAEFGFALITKAGIKGSVSLKFVRA